jgi:hypothetical protein
MRSWGVAVIVVAALAGVGSLLAVAVADKRDLAFTLGVVPTQVAAPIDPGQPACQQPIDVRAAFSRVRFSLGTFAHPGPPMAVTVKDSATGRTLGRGALAPGYPDNVWSTVEVGRIPAGRDVSVCFRDLGPLPAAIYGGPDTDMSVATAKGQRMPADMSLVFLREHPASALSLVPDIFRRAALFHPRFVGAWTFWLLAVLFVVCVPALLARALVAAESE